MKTLIIYYSRTGVTKKLAQKIAGLIEADTEEIIDKDKREGMMGYLRSGRQAAAKKEAEIEAIRSNINGYDLVVIGTPVWVGTMAPAIRTFLNQEKENLKTFAFFSSQGSRKEQKVFTEMRKLLSREPRAKFFLSTKEVTKNEGEEKIKEFVNLLKS